VLHLLTVRKPDYRGTKLLATISLLLWIGVVLAGRWIAYVDYLLPEE